jgi:carbon storage regulator
MRLHSSVINSCEEDTMLVLSRRIGENIIIADTIQVTVLGVTRNRVQLGIVAPADVTVDRAEIHERKRQLPDAHPLLASEIGAWAGVPEHTSPSACVVKNLPVGEEVPRHTHATTMTAEIMANATSTLETD